MKFKNYLNEKQLIENCKSDIITIISKMDEYDVSKFGEWLYDTFFEDSEVDFDDDYEDDEDDDFSKEEVIELLSYLDEEQLQYAKDMLEFDDSEDDETNIDNIGESELGELAESIGTFTSKNKNKKKRKFMKNSKAFMRKTKVKRQQLNRMTKVKRKRYARKGKAKKARNAKLRNKAIKNGTHIVKKRRNAG